MTRHRLLTPAADGSHVLRAGRTYRLVLLVNGQTTIGELGDALCAVGFVPAELAVTAEEDWPELGPRDWPEEPPFDCCANECLVRASGPFDRPAVAIERDMPIGGGALLSIAAAWDYAPEDERTGAAPPARGHDAPEDTTTRNALVVVGLAAVGAGIWAVSRSASREKDEGARAERQFIARERDALASRTQQLILGGRTREDAEQIAEREAVARIEALDAVEREREGAAAVRGS